jgi:putative endonuclease
MAIDLSNRARGQWGENIAASHYERAGYRIVGRNWRSPTGELDLIAEIGGVIVFAEVKTRRTDRFGPAAAAVGFDKQRRIRRLAVEFLRANDIHADTLRFDVVAITGNRVEVIEAAF